MLAPYRKFAFRQKCSDCDEAKGAKRSKRAPCDLIGKQESRCACRERRSQRDCYTRWGIPSYFGARLNPRLLKHSSPVARPSHGPLLHGPPGEHPRLGKCPQCVKADSPALSRVEQKPRGPLLTHCGRSARLLRARGSRQVCSPAIDSVQQGCNRSIAGPSVVRGNRHSLVVRPFRGRLSLVIRMVDDRCVSVISLLN